MLGSWATGVMVTREMIEVVAQGNVGRKRSRNVVTVRSSNSEATVRSGVGDETPGVSQNVVRASNLHVKSETSILRKKDTSTMLAAQKLLSVSNRQSRSWRNAYQIPSTKTTIAKHHSGHAKPVSRYRPQKIATPSPPNKILTAELRLPKTHKLPINSFPPVIIALNPPFSAEFEACVIVDENPKASFVYATGTATTLISSSSTTVNSSPFKLHAR